MLLNVTAINKSKFLTWICTSDCSNFQKNGCIKLFLKELITCHLNFFIWILLRIIYSQLIKINSFEEYMLLIIVYVNISFINNSSCCITIVIINELFQDDLMNNEKPFSELIKLYHLNFHLDSNDLKWYLELYWKTID